MLKILLCAALSFAAAPALARPSTLSMSCDEALDLVYSRGEIVLSTGRNTFDKFVASAGFCRLGEYAYDGWAPTRDTPRCRLAYVCKHDTPLFDDMFDIPGRR